MIVRNDTFEAHPAKLIPLHFDATEKNLAIFRFGHSLDLVGRLQNHLMSPFRKDETGHGCIAHPQESIAEEARVELILSSEARPVC